jgi:hypothetical protein
VGARIAAGARVGRGTGPGGGSPAAALHLRGRRPEAVDLPVPGRGRARDGRRGEGDWQTEAGNVTRADYLAQLPIGPAAAGVCQRPVPGGRGARGSRRRVQIRGRRRLPGR